MSMFVQVLSLVVPALCCCMFSCKKELDKGDCGLEAILFDHDIRRSRQSAVSLSRKMTRRREMKGGEPVSFSPMHFPTVIIPFPSLVVT